jgi:hypothetical protein
MTPPEGSVTVPVSAPVEPVCAQTGEVQANITARQRNNDRTNFGRTRLLLIATPPLFDFTTHRDSPKASHPFELFGHRFHARKMTQWRPESSPAAPDPTEYSGIHAHPTPVAPLLLLPTRGACQEK